MDLPIVRHELSMDGNRRQREFLLSEPSLSGLTDRAFLELVSTEPTPSVVGQGVAVVGTGGVEPDPQAGTATVISGCSDRPTYVFTSGSRIGTPTLRSIRYRGYELVPKVSSWFPG
jgi:hypothetical protein